MSEFFSTQELIREFEPAFCDDLFQRSLLIVGLGGNGTHLALAAVRMGFRSVVGVDCDVVSESNLSRHSSTPGAISGGARRKRRPMRCGAQPPIRGLAPTTSTSSTTVAGSAGWSPARTSCSWSWISRGRTFFAVDTCYSYWHGKAAVGGGTCVLSGSSARVTWMVPGHGPCLNCSAPPPPAAAEWVRFYRYDGGEPKVRTPAVDEVDARINLGGGHPLTPLPGGVPGGLT